MVELASEVIQAQVFLCGQYFDYYLTAFVIDPRRLFIYSGVNLGSAYLEMYQFLLNYVIYQHTVLHSIPIYSLFFHFCKCGSNVSSFTHAFNNLSLVFLSLANGFSMLLFYFNFFLGLHPQQIKFPGQGSNQSCSCQPMPQPQQCGT